MTRAERVAEAQQLRAEGLKLREIAERMEAPITTVGEWVTDPDGAKHRARRMTYAGTCIDCGKPTDGSRGPGKASKRCLSCDQHRNDERNARILAAWEGGDTGRVIAEREGMSEGAVLSWIDKQRNRNGRAIALHRHRDRELWPLIEERWRAGVRGVDIAAELGISPTNLSMQMRVMRRVGIDLPFFRRGPKRKAAA